MNTSTSLPQSQAPLEVAAPRLGPLAHVKVLDLSRILAAPWASQILADLGAEVIKVERPGVGDDTRAWGPPYLRDADGRDTSEAGYYLAVNRGKRSITVSLDKPEGQRIVRELALKADIVLENYKVGSLARYGLDAQALRQINPRLIYCSVTGFGQTGPRREQAAYDFLIQAMGGLMSVTGEKDGRPGGGPQKVGVPIVDLMTGMYAAVAVLAALARRDRCGMGDDIDIAMLDVQVATLANQAMNYLVSDQVYENQIDHFHTALLHNNMTVEGLDSKVATGASLQGGFGEMPIIDWHTHSRLGSRAATPNSRIASSRRSISL